VHSVSMCLIDSLSTPHNSQKAVGSICLRCKISFVRRNSCRTRHQKPLTFEGTCNFQIFF
jgi:hypothetical protein